MKSTTPTRNLLLLHLVLFSATRAFVISSQPSSAQTRTTSTAKVLHVLKDQTEADIVEVNGFSNNNNINNNNGKFGVAPTRKKQHHSNGFTVKLTEQPEAEVDMQKSMENLVKGANGVPKNGKKVVDAVYVAETKLPTDIGDFMLRAYRVPGQPVGQEPCVIYARDKPPMGGAAPARAVPARIHDQCLTSEVFGSRRCDCKEQLLMSLQYIQKHGGFIVYLQQEGRGIGLANKIAAYALQDLGFDTVDANRHLGFADDMREYDVLPSILSDMNVASIQLMTNNPRKVERLTALHVDVVRTLPMVVPSVNIHNRKYMETKQTRMNHANLAELLQRSALNNNGATAPGTFGMSPSAVKHMTARRGGAIANGATAANGASSSSYQLDNDNHQVSSSPFIHDYINNGTEMSANAVHVSLLQVAAEEELLELEEEQEDSGVKAHKDGYCFGRQSVEEAIAATARGEMVVVVDDMDRENEGDFIMAADMCTPMDVAKIIRYSSGVICVALEDDRLQELNLPPMCFNNEDPKGTAFTVSVDATKEHGITTGISATDRSTTIRMLTDPKFSAKDFHRPGHIFPLRARPGGVLARDGHTEAAVDLARLAGLRPAGVLCEIVSEENPTEMMRLPEIKRFCKEHGYCLTSIVDIAQYRRDTEEQQQQQQ